MNTRYVFAIYREKLFARRERVADFAFGRRPLPLPEPLERWIAANGVLATKAASPDDTTAFDEAARAFLTHEYGIDTRELAVLPAPGGRNAMSAFVACALAPGDHILVTEPGYPALAALAAQRGAVVNTVPLRPDRGFTPDIDVLDAATRSSIAAVCVNYPSNPTGAIVTDDLVAMLETLLGDSATLFNDAVYGPLCYESTPRSLLNAVSVVSQRTLELHAMTKLYPLGPLSISFLAGARELLAPIATYSEYAWSASSALQLGASTWCLCDREGLSERRAFFANQIYALRNVLMQLGFEPFETPSGIYVLCPVPGSLNGKAVDSAADAAMRLMDELDIAVVPWDVGSAGYLRFSALYRPEDLERLASLAGVIDIGPSR